VTRVRSDGARSVRELKSFARVSLAAGEKQSVELPVRVQDLRHWSETTAAWVVDPRVYSVMVGPSGASEDLRLAGTFSVRD
jgi:beta-glucosidase